MRTSPLWTALLSFHVLVEKVTHSSTWAYESPSADDYHWLSELLQCYQHGLRTFCRPRRSWGLGTGECPCRHCRSVDSPWSGTLDSFRHLINSTSSMCWKMLSFSERETFKFRMVSLVRWVISRLPLMRVQFSYMFWDEMLKNRLEFLRAGPQSDHFQPLSDHCMFRSRLKQMTF